MSTDNQSQPSPLPALLDYPAAQAYLGGISRWKVKQLVADDLLRCVKLGKRAMFRRDDLDALIKRLSAEDV